MVSYVDLKIHPDHISDWAYIRKKALKKLQTSEQEDLHFTLVRRSVDARKYPIFQVRLRIDKVQPEPVRPWSSHYRQVRAGEAVIIVGAGPAGYFAALECLELGLRPIVIDRGKDVRRRRRDLRNIQQEGVVNPNSNYCFGEGGAGTYSDGKLYTRSKKRGNVQKVLEVLVEHGATPDILIDAHPHIGSNKLPKIITNLRETILHFGGSIHFDQRVVDIRLSNGAVSGILTEKGDKIPGKHIILATGHSARDIYDLFDRKGWLIESKPFAIGVRIEHPQPLIDEIQYRQKPRHPNLPAASYRLACERSGTGVFSFCMCPGGLIVPTATAPGELVVNGMSLSRRDSPYANSGLVVAMDSTVWKKLGYQGSYGGLQMQKDLEQTFFAASNGRQAAPSQRVVDFLQKNKSQDLPPSSYIPGLISADLNTLLPAHIIRHIAYGLSQFDRKMPGYISSEAVLVGLESRTSAPVRMPREESKMMHPQVKGLYPAGEGAGYAGGIVSAAIDGQTVARAVKSNIEHKR